MDNIVSDVRASLDKKYPNEMLTLDEACNELRIVEKTIRNKLSKKPPTCPFPVVKLGKKVLVAKQVLAVLISGGNPFAEEDKPKSKVGRPKNSAGLSRVAAQRLISIYEEWDREAQQNRIEEKRRLIASHSHLDSRNVNHL